MISYREIFKRDPDGAKLLLLLAQFDNRDIWYELIKSSHHSSNVPDWLEKDYIKRTRVQVRCQDSYRVLPTRD